MSGNLQQNFFEYQPTKDLNRLLREYGNTCLSDTQPAPPEGKSNINWQTDNMGHISAWVEPGGGGGVTQLLAGANISLNPSNGMGAVTITSEGSGDVNVLPRGTYSSGTTYAQNDVVFDTGGSYISLINGNVGNNPLTDTAAWAPFAAQGPQGEPGDGGVVPGTIGQVGFYTTDGLSIQGGANTSAPSFSNNNQSNQYDAFWAGTLSVGFDFQQPVTLPSSTFYPDISDYNYFAGWNIAKFVGTVQGSGFSLGNAGGWTGAKGLQLYLNDSVRGIHQNFSHVINKHATGDTAATYGYVFADGGVSAASDEGVTGTQTELNENFGYYHGTVVSSTGVNDLAPVWSAATAGSNWTTDGAFMMNISRPMVTSNVTSGDTRVNLVLELNGTPTSTYLYTMPCTASSIPLSTAVGYQIIPNWSSSVTYTNREVVLYTDGNYYQSAIAGNLNQNPVTSGNWSNQGNNLGNVFGIPNQQCTADSPVPCTFTVQLATFNSATPEFAVGDYIDLAGSNYPEQSKITAVTTTGSGTNIVQRITCLLRNPNLQVIVFKGGVAGGFISSAANLAFSGMRSSYYAFGSIDGTRLAYGLQVGGGVAFNTLPQAGSEQWTSDNTSASTFTIYPGAEIVSNPDYYNPAGHIEQNNVDWTAGDDVENPHYPVFGGTAAWFTKLQYTPANPGHGSYGILGTFGGAGFAGGNTGLMQLQNQNPSSYYQNGGGSSVLGAPDGLIMAGPVGDAFYVFNAPQTNLLLHVQNSFNGVDTPDQTAILYNYAPGGDWSFSPARAQWSTHGSMQCSGNGYSYNDGSIIHAGANGTFTSADSKTVTVLGGLVVSIV